MFYVATNRRSWDRDDFYAQGRDIANSTLDWAGDVDRSRMLEVGCGAGRMLIHFAPRFDRVDGVDIAPETIEAAHAGCLPQNVALTVTSGSDLKPFEDRSFGFVFSLLVFQHIPDREIVSGYLDEIARVMKPEAKGVLQFDTRANAQSRRLALRLPDALLPRTHRRFIRRYPLPRDWPAARLRDNGLEILDEKAAGSGNHQILCARQRSA